MQRVREEFDADQATLDLPVTYKTNKNRFEIACDICHRTYYVDKWTFEEVEQAMSHDSEYRFICPDCEQDYDVLAFE